MKKLLLALLLFPSLAYAGGGCDIIALNDTSCKLLLKAVQSSDHLTEMTTSSAWTCKKSENGGATAACAGSIAELSDADSPGTLVYTFAAADVDTAGSLHIHVTATGMDPIDATTQVGLPYNVVTARGTLQAAASTTATIASAESSADNRWAGTRISILSGTAAGSYGCVASNVNATDVLTLDSGGWSGGTPDSTSTYDLVPDAACAGRVNSTGVAAIWANAITEITAVPGVGGITASALLRYLYQFATYRFDTTNSEQRWYRGDGTTVWTTKDFTDNGTIYDRTAQEADD